VQEYVNEISQIYKVPVLLKDGDETSEIPFTAVRVGDYWLVDLFFMLPQLERWTNPREELIKIPNFVGRTYESILTNEEYDELFVFHVEYETNDDVEKGYIIRQIPPADSDLRKPSGNNRINVRLVVSEGDEPLTEMPDLTGLHYVTAQHQLIRLDLDLQVTVEAVVREEGRSERGVVFETTPAPGSMIARGEIITIRYSVDAED
jgi:beta-lactam-binding protein with PASTA domain